jgi:hypothetical protein
MAYEGVDANLAGLLQGCGCTIIIVPDSWIAKKRVVVVRFPIIFSFLKRHVSDFDRILMADIFDTVFQGDPFHKDLGRDFIGISEESIPCDRMQKESGALLVERGLLNAFWYEDNCKNLGVLIGGINPMMQFLEILSRELRSVRSTLLDIMEMADQVIANVLYGSGLLSKINIRIWREADEYRAIWNLFDRANVTYRIGEYRLFADGKYPLVVHMYDRGKRFLESVVEACPSFPTVFPYVRYDRVVWDV